MIFSGRNICGGFYYLRLKPEAQDDCQNFPKAVFSMRQFFPGRGAKLTR
jgi:hypothetical protein